MVPLILGNPYLGLRGVVLGFGGTGVFLCMEATNVAVAKWGLPYEGAGNTQGTHRFP